MDILHDRDPIRSQAGKHQRGAGPQIRAGYLRARKALHPVDNGRIALYFNIRAHARQLIHILEPVLENTFCDNAAASRQRQSHRNLRLHVCRKARVRKGLHICALQPLRADHAHRVVQFFDLAANLQKL